MFLSPAMQLLYRGAPLSQLETDRFLSAYPEAETVERYQRLKPWYHWRMSAYCHWRKERGATDYAAALDLELDALAAT